MLHFVTKLHLKLEITFCSTTVIHFSIWCLLIKGQVIEGPWYIYLGKYQKLHITKGNSDATKI